MRAQTPEKLVHDSIVSATCEVRFDSADTREAPEVVVGVLSKNPKWKSFLRKRLPEADIPEQVRQIDPNLRDRPVFELVDPSGGRRVRIGRSVISTTRDQPYPGWSQMLNEIREVADVLYGSLEDVSVRRLGLRYINVLVPALHHVSSIHELRFSVSVMSQPFSGELNLNFGEQRDGVRATIRIATPGFINNMSPAEGIGVIDIDTFTDDTLDYAKEDVISWLNQAHHFEKAIFFGLFDDDLLEKNVETWG